MRRSTPLHYCPHAAVLGGSGSNGEHNCMRGFDTFLLGHGLSDRTVELYVGYARRFADWCEDRHHDPHQPEMIWAREWSDTLPYTWSSRKIAATTLHWWSDYIGADDLADAVRKPRKPRMRSKALDDDDASALEEAAFEDGWPRGVAVLLGLYLGMRRVEIARATWSSWSAGRWAWQRAKTGDLTRLPVHPRLSQLLLSSPKHSTYVFPGDKGRPHVSPATVWQWTRDLSTEAGLGLVSTHQLRHTFITALVDQTGNLRIAQEAAGHRDPTVTSGYTRVRDQQLDSALSKLGYSHGQEGVQSQAG